jgi:choline dehydrogenase-like flavoprotein
MPGNPVRLASDVTRPLFLGGNTNHWFGNCRPLDESDFGARDWIPYSGWPLSRDELLPYYERAQRSAGLGAFRWYDLEACVPWLEHGPLTVDPAVLDTRILHTCPVLSFADLRRAELEQSAGVEVLLGMRVNRLHFRTTAGRVTSAELVDGEGRRSSLEADVFVLAAGGIENALVLLELAANTSDGLGSGRDLIGRYFMEHWYFDLELPRWDGADVALYEAPYTREGYQEGQNVGDAWVWAQLVLSQKLMREERVPGLALWFSRARHDPPSVVSARRFARALLARRPPDLADARRALADPVNVTKHLAGALTGRSRPFVESYSLRVELEQVPDPENRVRIAQLAPAGHAVAELALRLGDEELQRAQSSLARVASSLGLDSSLLPDKLGQLHDDGRYGFFFHHMGTTRMSDDSAAGVVDRNCRVHGTENLFAVGTSVFPTGGTAAPTLTAVALALRLADHLTTTRPDGGLTSSSP